MPAWTVNLLRFQVGVVYLFAGLAKLNADWLAGEPMRTWLKERGSYAVIGPLLASEPAAYFFSWGGALFDLSIGFLLLSRRTLPIAFALILLVIKINIIHRLAVLGSALNAGDGILAQLLANGLLGGSRQIGQRKGGRWRAENGARDQDQTN